MFARDKNFALLFLSVKGYIGNDSKAILLSEQRSVRIVRVSILNRR